MTSKSKTSTSPGPEPWAPEGAARVGAPPVDGQPGERGTYDGDGPSDQRGPDYGAAYHDGSELGTGVIENSREA